MSEQQTPENRIAASMEEISHFIGEIRDMLQELSGRPEVDNVQLARIADAVSEIARVIPVMLMR